MVKMFARFSSLADCELLVGKNDLLCLYSQHLARYLAHRRFSGNVCKHTQHIEEVALVGSKMPVPRAKHKSLLDIRPTPRSVQ